MLAQAPAFKTVVDRLCCMRGIAVLGAMVLVSELYDLRRFSHPRQLMAFLGLVPRENSSGDRQQRGRITKMGNAHARRIVVEAAWAYRYRHRSGGSPRLRRALVGQPAEVVAVSRKASQRLSQRYARLVGRGKSRPHACTSVARELCGFLWAIGKDATTATADGLTPTM